MPKNHCHQLKSVLILLQLRAIWGAASRPPVDSSQSPKRGAVAPVVGKLNVMNHIPTRLMLESVVHSSTHRISRWMMIDQRALARQEKRDGCWVCRKMAARQVCQPCHNVDPARQAVLRLIEHLWDRQPAAHERRDTPEKFCEGNQGLEVRARPKSKQSHKSSCV